MSAWCYFRECLRKVKEAYLYSAFYILCISQRKYAGQRPTFYHCATQPYLLSAYSQLFWSYDAHLASHEMRICSWPYNHYHRQRLSPSPLVSFTPFSKKLHSEPFWIKIVHFVHCFLLRDPHATYRHSAVYARVWGLVSVSLSQSTENWGGQSAIASPYWWPMSTAMWQYKGYPDLFVGFVQIPIEIIELCLTRLTRRRAHAAFCYSKDMTHNECVKHFTLCYY